MREIDPKLLGNVFYSRLFLEAPELRSLFKPDMEPQYKKLLDMLSYVVVRLDRLDTVLDDVGALAERHTGYGVKPEHYELVGRALLWTLQTGLDRDWNPEVAEAWTAFYTAVATEMIQRGYPSEVRVGS
ncbi:globin domain-containing protein [Tellurirhabdus rosea]|uniref:globin domain-containing protein n=1 Tax=Tellurirhabdus rosea TaxID=2674997 RepID=UPI002255177F|nr:globin domain-containing protein [Tellurirhabdus rosea]